MAEQEFKDSNIEWIGVIPKSWEIIPNKYVMAQIKDIRPVYKGEQILSLSQKGVIVRDLDNPSGKMPKTFDGYQYVKRGNLLMCLFDIDVTPRCIGLIQNDGLCSPAYSQFALNERGYSPYYYYYYLNLDFKKELLHLAKNLRHSLTEEQLGNIPVPCPPIQEQKKIANFLDSKCEEIDALCADIEKQIETLQEYKKSVITEAVTKGLDPNVEMKDSGVDWIGKIPFNWTLKPLKFLLSSPLQYGASESGQTEETDDSYRYVRITDINADGTLKEENKLFLPNALGRKYSLEHNDILFARSGASVGKTYIHKKVGLYSFAGYLIKNTLLETACIPDYFYLYTKSHIYDNWKNSVFSQATIPNISAEKLSQLNISLPPIQAQREIVNFLEKKCNNINDVIDPKNRQLETLAQYKQSLIYEYVTGKKAVPANF